MLEYRLGPVEYSHQKGSFEGRRGEKITSTKIRHSVEALALFAILPTGNTLMYTYLITCQSGCATVLTPTLAPANKIVPSGADGIHANYQIRRIQEPSPSPWMLGVHRAGGERTESVPCVLTACLAHAAKIRPPLIPRENRLPWFPWSA
jgi:hypothetical protein